MVIDASQGELQDIPQLLERKLHRYSWWRRGL